MAKDKRQNISKPNSGSSNTAAKEQDSLLDLQDSHGNAAMKELLSGPVGRIFERVVEGGGNEATVDSLFSQQELHGYLEGDIAFAEGEWFRSKKLDGATSALMEELDADASGDVSWTEFSAMSDKLIEAVAEGVDTGDRDAVQSAAIDSYRSVGGSGESISMEQMQEHAERALPPETEHRSLVAQLTARLAIDAIDTDQIGQPMSERSISQAEWTQAALDMSKNSRS
jgi:hypothetical protein